MIEKLIYPPRKALEAVLWITEHIIPPNPELPRIGASITILKAPENE